MTVRIGDADIILYVLCLSCHRIVHVTIHDLMKLQDIISCQRNHIKAFMNDRKHISISCNLLLISVLGSGLLLNQLSDSCTCRDNSFDCIGCLCTLNLRNLNQLLQFFRSLFQIEFLFADFFINCSNQPQDLRIPFLISDS